MRVKSHSYTFFIAASDRGTLRKIGVPVYILHLLVALAFVGGIAGMAALGSYSRMRWRLADYNALRLEGDILKRQNQELRAAVSETNERLSSLQSLATEVAMTYGFLRFREAPFGLTDAPVQAEAAYQRSVEQFNFLKKNPTAVFLAAEGLRLMPRPGLGDARLTPSLWPVIGHISGSFGDGVVAATETRPGYGRLVVLQHGFGVSTWYGHLSRFNTQPGTYIRRGDVIGFVGVSGRVTGPHVHYEVRINGAPVNPWRYLRFTAASD